MPLLSPVQVQAILEFSADDMVYTLAHETAGTGRDQFTGFGQLDAPAALSLALKPAFVVRDSDEKHIMSVDYAGNLIVAGIVLQQRTALQMTTRSNLGHSSFKVKDSSGGIQALIDSANETYAGTNLAGQNLYLRGTVYTEAGPLTPPAAAFVIRNAAGTPVAFFDDSGNVYLKGRLFQGANPDPDA